MEYMVSSKEFPIQTTLTAVKMILQPGALREMHWHPHADEWQYYIHGKARVGSSAPTAAQDRGVRTGPRRLHSAGYGHYVEQIGDEPTELLILFNSAEYQEISLANWLGGNPSTLLEDNFSLTKTVVDQLPKKEKGILAKG